ncbi:hypothetical protein [uncultured Leifsonia sp.]|uniref:hypothetical protein n=1 Tax=uncultured Leifsonia sp. TaxID=340359 RepID=UPI0028D6B144|nr:hypothetical protein [uncultured Leifsonia sp.]
MTSKAPTVKVVAGGAAGAAVTIAVWIAGLFGLEVPSEVAGAAVVLVTFAAAYVVPDRTAGRHTAD